MFQIGEILKEKREKLGYSISEISDITTIQERYIIALENNDFETIPGEYYVKSFLKQYATILKLDSNKLIKSYEKGKDELEKQNLKGAVITDNSLERSIQVEQSTETHQQIDNMQRIVDEEIDVTQLSKPMVKPAVTATIDNEFSNDSNEQHNKQTSKIAIGIIVIVVIALLVFLISLLVRSIMPTQTKTTTTTTSSSVLVTSSSELITDSTSTSESATESTPENTTTTVETTTIQSTTQSTVSSNTQSTAVHTETQQADVYVISSNASDTNYGLGSSYKGYTGDYHLGVTVSEPTWVRMTIFGQVVYEGTLVPNGVYNFKALNNAQTIELRLGVAQAAKLTLNGHSVTVPSGNRVQNIKFTLPR